MKKKLLFTLLGVLIALPVLARDFEYEYEGQTLTYTVIDENAKTCMTKIGSTYASYNKVSGELIIPEIAKDGDVEYSVTEIGGQSFFYCSGLTSVIIPNSVTTIGLYAFENCDRLSSVLIGNSVETILSEAFSGCDALIKTAYPNTLENPFSSGVAFVYNPESSIIEDGFIYGPEKKKIIFAPYSLTGDYVIPESVTSIGISAFYKCTALTSVTIPESVTSIGSSAFSQCTALTSVTIPESVTSIGSSAFNYCSGLTSVTIPESVTSIENDAFNNCSGLGSVTIGNSVKSIGHFAFKDCTALTSVIIPNSVTYIGSGAFVGCSLKKSAYPDNLSNPFPNGIAIAYNPVGAIIEDGWIYGPEKKEIIFAPPTLKGNFTIPESVTSFGNYAFAGCSGLTSVTIGNSVTSIGGFAFDGCSGLAEVTIGNSVESINNYAFRNCSGLNSVIIGNSVESIGYSVFQGCSGLTDVVTLSEKPATIYSTSFDEVSYNRAQLTVPDNAVDNYLCTYWGRFNNIRQSGSDKLISTYSDNVLNYRLIPTANSDENNTAVIISGNYSGEISVPERFAYTSEAGETERYYVTGIGNNAFANSNVSKIDFNSRIDLKTIGAGAFRNCNYLTEISIPKTVETIGDDAFYGCSGLKEVTIPDLVTSIGSDAFNGCTGLTKAEFASIEQLCSVEFGDNYANPLYYTHNLYINGEEIKDLVIPESVTSIGNSAFNGCTALTSVTIGNSVKSIGESAFRYCSGLTSVTIPNSVSSIGNSTFYGCRGLTSVTIPESVTSIGGFVFGSCSGLKEVTIPDLVTSIGEYAFNYCTGLKEVTIPDLVNSIGKYAFNGCNFTQITIPASVESIGTKAIPATEVIISDSANPIELDNNSFYNNLTSLYWGRSLENFNIPVSSLQTLEIGNIVEEIPAGLFSGCESLTSLSLGSSLTTIGDNAFNGCTGLSEVVISPAAETIGASSFAGCSRLSSIVMGANVKTIGEKAFDGCPAETVSITAQTPPTAPNNAFSSYSGKLYLQGEEAIDAYYDALTCWDRFDSFQMIEPESIEMSKKNIAGKPGEKMQLSASLKPANVTLPHIFWYSTNPEIATVDNNGLVTFVGGNKMATRAAECKIIATSLYADGPVAEVTVTSEDILVTSLSFKQSNYTAEIGETIDLNDEVEILPADASDKTLTWTSSDESVATVSNGIVTVLGEGTCKITATTTDGSNLSATCNINDTIVGIDSIEANGLCDVYSVNGNLIQRNVKLGEATSLIPGIYIIRQGNTVKKICVK